MANVWREFVRAHYGFAIGGNLDEGTMFAPQNLKDEKVLEEHIGGAITLLAASRCSLTRHPQSDGYSPENPAKPQISLISFFPSILMIHLMAALMGPSPTQQRIQMIVCSTPWKPTSTNGLVP